MIVQLVADGDDDVARRAVAGEARRQPVPAAAQRDRDRAHVDRALAAQRHRPLARRRAA